jgi:hypothetical protein
VFPARTRWSECDAQVRGFLGARFKGFPTEAGARAFLEQTQTGSPAQLFKFSKRGLSRIGGRAQGRGSLLSRVSWHGQDAHDQGDHLRALTVLAMPPLHPHAALALLSLCPHCRSCSAVALFSTSPCCHRAFALPCPRSAWPSLCTGAACRGRDSVVHGREARGAGEDSARGIHKQQVVSALVLCTVLFSPLFLTEC